MLSDLRIGGAPIIQTADLVRSSYLRTFDRGNRRTEITFTLWAQFTTLGEAERYPLVHNAALPNKAPLVLTTSGPTATAYYLWQAALAKLPEYANSGLTVRISYAFIGGNLETNPEP